MADTTITASGLPTGWTVYTQIKKLDEDGNVIGVWDGSGYSAYNVSNWSSYATATPETPASSGIYVCQMPLSSPAAFYDWQNYKQVGASPASTDPLVAFSTSPAFWNGSDFDLTPVSNPSPIDLITSTYATQVLLAGGVTLSGTQSAILPNLITAASREMQRFMGRLIPLTTYTEIITPEGTRQDRGEPASAKLSAFPVQSITSVMTGRSGVLTIKNTDTSTNQFASVAFSFTGDAEWLDLVYTGLTLIRMASGVTTTNTVLFSSNVTLQALATAINAIGGGWSAQVQSNYGLYPSASLVGVREPKDALSEGACLEMFTKGAKGYSIDRSTGIFSCTYGNGWGWGGPIGDPAWDAMDGFGAFSGGWGWGQYQVVYQAGFSTIPADLQQIAAEVVKGMYARLNTDPSLKSETADKYSWAARDSMANLNDDQMRQLIYYRDFKV